MTGIATEWVGHWYIAEAMAILDANERHDMSTTREREREEGDYDEEPKRVPGGELRYE